MAYTTDARLDRLKRAASLLHTAGVRLESGGHSGVLNDFMENELEDYLRRKLEASGKSKSFVTSTLANLRRED